MGQVRAFVVAVALVPLVSTTAFAQVPAQRNADVQTFRPAPGPSNFLTVSGARVDGRFAVSAGLFANYSYNPVVTFDADCPNYGDDNGCRTGRVRSVPVRHLFTANLLASLTFARRIQIGLDVPVAVANGDVYSPVDLTTNGTTQTSASLADPRLYVKVRILGQGLQGFALAAEAFGQFPTGRAITSDSFVGDSTFGLGGRLIADERVGIFSLAVNAGAFWRPESQQFLTTTIGSRFQWGVAAGLDATPRLGFVLEGFGSTDFAAPSQYQNNTVEIDAAARYRLGPLVLRAGGGTGVVRGAGSPAARAFLGVQYAPFRADTDGDGVQDDDDRCPTVPEDIDGFEDRDGCPEPDNDRDGISDARDRCPNEPEDIDHFEDEDGCPDRDNDHDGIPDDYDSCPNAAEDRDGDRDEDGCPDDDRDRDGIPDARDRCANEPEDTDGFEDEDGCPEPDNDHDGVPDESDQCGEQPETINGYQDGDGCPDTVPDRDHDGVTDAADRCPTDPEDYNGVADDDGCPEHHGHSNALVENGELRTTEPIEFADETATLTGAGGALVDQLAFLIVAHPEFPRVDVRGYTDNVGDAAQLLALSQQRADAIRNRLVAHGVDGSRVVAHGFGAEHPIGDNTHATGRHRNRRVELHVIAADRPAPAPADGEPAAETPAPTPPPAPVPSPAPATEQPPAEMTFGVDGTAPPAPTSPPATHATP